MTLRPDIQAIVDTLQDLGVIEQNSQVNEEMKGTTEGLVYILTVNKEKKYVLKVDTPQSNSCAELLLAAYPGSSLLPKLLYTDPHGNYILYTYTAGTTHYNRGAKIDWLTGIVTGLLNHYETSSAPQWGRLEMPRDSWAEFNRISLEEARSNVGDILPAEDYDKVQSLSGRISGAEDKYLLHGDTGVHNFVFQDHSLVGVIDPSPMVGPLIYDFTYAFCSSPDDLNRVTLFKAFDQLKQKAIGHSRLIEEVVFQLYCRIGICARVHPQDLKDYLTAWEHWRTHLV
ncbi:phosphotransferase [Paenibacillus sp. FSL L8-0463]|uniref:phosphotransferase n=1 Tax=Paenibacillus sp. FSL L8-0463 TaxID=2954687 RepID=UPI003119668C